MPDRPPSRYTPARSAVLIVGSFAAALTPIAVMMAVTRSDDRFVTLWIALGLGLTTVLLPLTALCFPRYMIIGFAPLAAPLPAMFMWSPLTRLAGLTVARQHVTLVTAGLAAWLIVLTGSVWITRKHWLPALTKWTNATVGRDKQIFEHGALALLAAAIVAGMAAVGWTTVWNAAHMTAAVESVIEVRVVETGTYTYPRHRAGRGTDVYWIVEDSTGDRRRIKRNQLLDWEWSTKNTWGAHTVRNHSCTKDADVEIREGDILTLAGRDGVLGFAVDYMAAVERGGQILCEAQLPPAVGARGAAGSGSSV